MQNNEEVERNEDAAAEAPAGDAPAETAAESENAAAAGAEDAQTEAAEADAAAEEDAVQEDADAPAPDAEPAPAGPDWKVLYARTLADFENFRKRTERDREDLVKFAASDLLKDLLATADNLALALDKAQDKEDAFVKGVRLVYDGFIKTLADHGAVPLDALGEPFDANFHEALTQQPSETVPEGHVTAVFKRGWLLHGKLLRAAQVVVSSGKPE